MKIFISYSHKDENYKVELLKHLSNLKRNGIIEDWHDRLITPGENWDESIKNALYECQVILFLISSDFLASDYIHDTEIKIALERYEKGEIQLVPLIVRPCDWKDTEFGKLQALPKDAKALSIWENLDEGLFNVVQGIKKIIEANPSAKKDTKQASIKYNKKKEAKIINQTAEKIYNINKIDSADFS